jgi:predicted RND superfamily exporter protein
MTRLVEPMRGAIRAIVRHAGLVVLAGLALSVAAMFEASKLRIDADLSKLVPSHYESVKALDRLRETVGAESEVSVGITSPSFEANIAFAETLVPRALELRDAETGEVFLSRVDFRRDVSFLEDNALYFATEEELERLHEYLIEEIEEAKLEANPFYFDLDEDEPAANEGDELRELYDDVIGSEYPVSGDSTTLVLRFFPSGSQTDLSFVGRLYEAVESAIEELRPSEFHAEMEVVTAGRLERQRVEVRAITRDVLRTMGLGITIVLLFVVGYFAFKAYRARTRGHFSMQILLIEIARIPLMSIVIGLPLIMSLAWTGGVAYLTIETLNLMTATLGLVLFGLGIDYGIHFFARYSEERAYGKSIGEAAETTFISSGQAIAVGALTTAAALYVLIAADFKGFSEFGLVAGTGILLSLVSMMVIMPALLVLLERWGAIDLSSEAPSVVEGALGERVKGARFVIVASTVAVAAAFIMLPARFEYDFSKLEPEFRDYDARNAVISRVYPPGEKRNPAYIVAETPEEIPHIVEALRAHAEADSLTPTILSVESLQDRFPLLPAMQRRKLERIAEIRRLLDEPFLSLESAADIDRLKRAAGTEAPIEIEQIPEFLRKQFTSKSGELGNFAVVYASVGLSDGLNSMAFSDDVGTVTTTDGGVYYAGSTSLIAADMLRLMQEESLWLVLGAFGIVVLFMRMNFTTWKWAGMATIPLVVGFLWMILVMEILDIKLTFYNLIVLPAVLGIGNDAGVHMIHRYLEEGGGSIRIVIRSTGEHIAIGSLTTMMGFAGPLLSFHPGLRSIGLLAVIGIGATLASALIFLPALIQELEDRGWGAASRAVVRARTDDIEMPRD